MNKLIDKINNELVLLGAETEIKGTTIIGKESYIGSFVVTVNPITELVFFDIENTHEYNLDGFEGVIALLKHIKPKRIFARR